MLSPFFELRSREVPFYDLHDSAVLPFIEDSEKDQKIRPRHGHHGNVWRVKIHRAHHDWVEVLLSFLKFFFKQALRLTSS